MPSVDHGRKQVLLKLVYYGPGLGGKTTNLELIHARTRAEHRGKLLSLNSDSERTLFFDLLPMFLGAFKGYQIRLQLCTVPGQVSHDSTRRMILRNVDGVVFVVDSQPAAEEANIASFANLGDNLRLQGVDPDQLPVAVQYNKRDLANVPPVEILHRRLGIRADVPEFGASAKFGDGVFETLKGVVKEVLKSLGDPSEAPQGRVPSILPGVRASMYPGVLVGTASPLEEPRAEARVPLAPRVPKL